MAISGTGIFENIREQRAKLKNMKKTALAGSAVGALFSIFDFADVPAAFKSQYDSTGKAVEGTNFKCGLKETGKSSIKCLSYFAVPALISSLAFGGGVVLATLIANASFASGFALGPLWEKILPSERTLVEKACKQKGIDYKMG